MIKLSDIKPNPDNPRIIRDAKFEQLKKSIQEFPAMLELRPMVIDADNVVLGGNMRLRALQDLGYKEIPDTWVKRAEELTEDEKRRFIIVDNVGYGEWDWDAIANAWDVDEVRDWGLDVPVSTDDNSDEPYTKKIEAPIYEPKDQKPDAKELCDTDKAMELIKEIDQSNIPEIDKKFLRLAAYRHVVFDYEKIAEYYAHSDAGIQKLMEKSALVIIDFNQAIELNYIKLSEALKEQFAEEYEQ